MIKYPIIFLIYLYQNFISPYKGYRCAYSVVYGGTGCSGAVKNIILNESIFKWKHLISERFSSCKDAKRKHDNWLIPCECLDPDVCAGGSVDCDCGVGAC